MMAHFVKVLIAYGPDPRAPARCSAAARPLQDRPHHLPVVPRDGLGLVRDVLASQVVKAASRAATSAAGLGLLAKTACIHNEGDEASVVEGPAGAAFVLVVFELEVRRLPQGALYRGAGRSALAGVAAHHPHVGGLFGLPPFKDGLC